MAINPIILYNIADLILRNEYYFRDIKFSPSLLVSGPERCVSVFPHEKGHCSQNVFKVYNIIARYILPLYLRLGLFKFHNVRRQIYDHKLLIH